MKYFLITVISGVLLWWGAGILEKRLETFFYWLEMAGNQHLLAGQEAQVAFWNRVNELRPFRNNSVNDLDISAKSAISILVDNQSRERILFEKEKNEKLPIASLTKLMTAKIVLDQYDLSKEIKISEQALAQEEDFGRLTLGKNYPVKYLLYPLLMESSNDAAFALANDYDGLTQEAFVKLMNQEAQKLSLPSTAFFNPTGLDPEEPDKNINYSTASDLSKLIKNLLKKPLLWEILSTSKLNGYGPELLNNNELLGKTARIVGGKTGYTEKALGCFILVLEAPRGKGYIVNVILGTDDRFGETKKLIDWLYSAYNW